MGVRMPGSVSGLVDPKVVEKLIEAERIPIKNAEKRKEETEQVKEEFQKLEGFVSELDSSLNALKTRSDFYKLKVDSSHPDILEGTVDTVALPGTYEFEVRGMAKTEKELAFGFPDKDDTPVGFGYMMIQRADQEEIDVTIEPDSTLQDVVTQINDADAGVKAMIINTKYQPNPYRLLVVSEQSGEEARLFIDEDTTFLEFKEQVTGRNLDVLFEDVPVTDEDNTLEELVDGVVFFVKRAEPGTRVQVNVTFDMDATVESVKSFVEKYNQIAEFINQQFVVDPKTKRAGLLAGDGTIKTVLRNLQTAYSGVSNPGEKYGTLAQIGITTDEKTGMLNIDETKVKQALAEDYHSVAKLFIRTKDTVGIADRIAAKVKDFRDPGFGVLKSRSRALDRIIRNQDEIIAKRERSFAGREETIKRQFTALEGQLAALQSQSNFLAAKLGGQPVGGNKNKK